MSTKENILKSIAPCSMFCSTCTGCSYGEISNHAKKLLHYLEGHEEFLEKNLKKGYEHKLEEFRIFHRKLKNTPIQNVMVAEIKELMDAV